MLWIELSKKPLNDNYNYAPLTIRNAHIGGTVSGAKLTLISLRRADDSNRRTSEDSNERTKERTYPKNKQRPRQISRAARRQPSMSNLGCCQAS